jgi:hypothetical protein
MMTDEQHRTAAGELAEWFKLKGISPHDAYGVVGSYVVKRLVEGAANWADAATGLGLLIYELRADLSEQWRIPRLTTGNIPT